MHDRRKDPRSHLVRMTYRGLDATTQHLVRMDLARITELDDADRRGIGSALGWAVTEKPGFRAVFYHRCLTGRLSRGGELALRATMMLIPRPQAIEIRCKDIGGGLLVFHHTCVIGARRIGENVSVGAGAVIGKRHGELPVLEDGALISANATVIGGITIGQDAVVGAGAVVLEDVPAGATVVGNPAHIVDDRQNAGQMEGWEG